MVNLLEKINAKLIESMKSKNQVAMDVLRMVKTAVKEKEIELKRELKEEEIIGVLRSQIKSREDSASQFKEANRCDLSSKEEKEIAVIKEFLPQNLKPEELENIVKKAIEEAKVQSKADMGKVMPLAIKAAKGRASGEEIKNLVLKMLP